MTLTLALLAPDPPALAPLPPARRRRAWCWRCLGRRRVFRQPDAPVSHRVPFNPVLAGIGMARANEFGAGVPCGWREDGE